MWPAAGSSKKPEDSLAKHQDTRSKAQCKGEPWSLHISPQRRSPKKPLRTTLVSPSSPQCKGDSLHSQVQRDEMKIGMCPTPSHCSLC